MLFTDFLQWWYGPGWLLRVRLLGEHMRGVIQYFSLGTLVMTLFSPWRQNVTVTHNDEAMDAKVQALLDNVVSRTVGFFVRLIMIVVAILAIVVTLVLNSLYIITWPILPLSPAIILAVGAIL